MLNPVLEIGSETNILLNERSPRIQTMLNKAVELMTHSKDPGHGVDHINHLLKNANRFFKATGDTFRLDKEVLLLAVYWHDVWKSQKKPTGANYLFHQLYEGLGSMFMFRKFAGMVSLSPVMIRDVSYAIRKHSAVQLRPAKTFEAQLLWDMDTLDIWNVRRVQAIFKSLRWMNISIFDSYILYMKNIGLHLNFEWTKNEVKRSKPLFFEAMSQFRESLMKRPGGHETLSAQPKAIFTEPDHTRSLQSTWNLDDKS